MSLSVEEILRADDIVIEAVDCPEWGGTAHVRTISADARDRFEMCFAEKKDKGGVRAALVGAALCDETGKFLSPTPAEITALGRKASGPMDRLFSAVMRINRMSSADVEALEKNSAPTGDDNSGSA